MLRAWWNAHDLRSTKGDGGVPQDRLQQQPYPGARLQLPQGVDMVARAEAARGRRLRRVPQWVAARDALHGRPAAQIAARIGLPMPFTYAPKRKGDDGAVAVQVDDYEEEDEFDASACA